MAGSASSSATTFVLDRPDRAKHAHRSLLQVPHQVRRPSQRRLICPTADRRSRSAPDVPPGKVERQPIKPVNQRERVIVARAELIRRLLAREQPTGMSGRALQEPRAPPWVALRDEPLKQLTHYAVEERAKSMR